MAATAGRRGSRALVGHAVRIGAAATLPVAPAAWRAIAIIVDSRPTALPPLVLWLIPVCEGHVMSRRIVIGLLILVGVLGVRPAWAEFSELAGRVPSDANTLVMIDMEKILASPAARKGEWESKLHHAFDEGLTILPPNTRRAVLGSKVDLEFMSQIWQTEIIEPTAPTNITEIATNTGGTVDKIGNLGAVRLPVDAYVVRFEQNVFGVMLPAHRQDVVRWAREVRDRNEPALSPYLREAYGYAAELGTPIVLAIDLQDAIGEEELHNRLKEVWEDHGFKGKADPLAVTKVLASIRGATLGITLRDKPFGAVKIDFDENVKPLAPIAKELFLAILERRGLLIEEFEEWKYAADGKQISLEGHFTSSGLRRVFSTFDRPPGFQTTAAAAPAEAPAPMLSKEQQTAQATKAYFQSVQKLLHDLRGRKAQSNTYTTGSIAQWCNNYGRKINNLPMLNVDPEMVEYGSQTAQTLANVAATLNGGNIQGGIGARSSSPVYNTYSSTNIYGYGYRGGLFWGGTVPLGTTSDVAVVDPRATEAQRANIRANFRAQSAEQARELMSTIDAATAEIRAKMVQKYQLEF
jgi:hypothetical protein